MTGFENTPPEKLIPKNTRESLNITHFQCSPLADITHMLQILSDLIDKDLWFSKA